MGSESGKGKTTHLGICDIRSFWLQVLGFPHARPRMYRFKVGVAACILIEAHSHTLNSFRRIKLSRPRTLVHEYGTFWANMLNYSSMYNSTFNLSLQLREQEDTRNSEAFYDEHRWQR